MGLRVLLADESSTIKKVLQLALQEYGVEVKPVPVGIDVITVAKSFKPDIIFADVLLSKRSGYEVCADIKSDSDLKDTPFVLMWSSFMEFDEKRASEVKPDRKLEKPFDAESLRKIVRDLVPRLKKSAVSDFLSYPSSPKEVSPSNTEIPEKSQAETPPKKKLESLEINLASGSKFEFKSPLEDLDDLSAPIKAITDAPEGLNSDLDAQPADPFMQYTTDDQWERMPLAPNENPDLENSKIIVASESDNDLNSPIQFQEVPLLKPFDLNPGVRTELGRSSSRKDDALLTKLLPGVTEEEIEQVVRAQIKEIVESIAWKLIPDIAERIIKEEVAAIMKTTEDSHKST